MNSTGDGENHQCRDGLEPATPCLQDECTDHWAIAKNSFYRTVDDHYFKHGTLVSDEK